MESKYKMILVAVLLGTFMTALDATIVSVALPTMSEFFGENGSNTSNISWILLVYTLMLCCFIMLWSKIGSNVGYKKIFMIGIGIFTVTSLAIGLCGLNDNIPLYAVILLRAVQGLGAGMSMATSLAIISCYLPEENRGTAMGAVTLAASLGMACGPAIGGLLTQFGWEYIFYINVPVGLVCLFMCVRYMKVQEQVSKCNIDFIGAALMFVFMFALIIYLNRATEWGWIRDTSVLVLAIMFLSIGVFLWWEGRVGDPLVSLRIIKDSNIFKACMVQFFMFMTMAGSYLLLPYFLGGVKGYSTSEYGLILIANSIGMMLSGPLVGKISDRTGNNRVFILAGAVITAVGMFLFMRFEPGTELWYIVLSLIVMGVGIGMAFVAATNVAFNYILPGEDGQMSGITNTFRQAGASAGVAILEAVFTATLATEVVGAGMGGYKQAFFIGLLFVLVALAIGFGIKDNKKEPAA